MLLERGRPRADPAANVPPPTAVDGLLMARRSWPSMGRCRQLAARRRPPGQGSPAPAGGGAPHSELFEHATRSAAAGARLVRQDEHPRKAQRVRHAPGASRGVGCAGHRFGSIMFPCGASAAPAASAGATSAAAGATSAAAARPARAARNLDLTMLPRHPTMFRADVSRKDQTRAAIGW